MKEEALRNSHEILKTPFILLIRFVGLPNVPLADEDAGMMDALGKSQLEDLSLQPPLQEILHFEAQDVIEFHLTLIQHTDPHQTSEQGVTWTISHTAYVKMSEDAHIEYITEWQRPH